MNHKHSMSDIMTLVLANPKARANMSAGAKRRWANKAERKRQRVRMKKALMPAAVRKEMSRAAKRRHKDKLVKRDLAWRRMIFMKLSRGACVYPVLD
jgi:hypothetical protein